MPDDGLFVNKYAVSAAVGANAVTWKLHVETANGERHVLDILDGAEVPLLLQMMQGDQTVYYNPATRTLSTGWNNPGESSGAQ